MQRLKPNLPLNPLSTSIEWVDPLALLYAIPDGERYWMLLYSGMHQARTGRYSYLALRHDAQLASDNFSSLHEALAHSGTHPLDRWFGYLGYGLKHALEHVPEDSASHIVMPALWMVHYRLLLIFDHECEEVTVWAKNAAEFAFIPKISAPRECETEVVDITSNMTKSEYLAHVNEVLEAIDRGELYQANLTRKFFGTLTQACPIHLFTELCKVSPSPYSAFFKYGECTILSSSPEQFITVGTDGMAVTRPIKGSAPRFDDREMDRRAKEALVSSEKNRAENLMIVDLMRNDLARSCVPGSVKVDSLFDCTSYATIHHLSSTISGQKKPEMSALELIKGCFPPGSMTGTPKIKAMAYCSLLEKQQRGIYSGAIGWMDQQCADLSVVIRTLILQGNKFEFQVGGAIVADSNPEEEWQETLTKARGIASILHIPMTTMEAI